MPVNRKSIYTRTHQNTTLKWNQLIELYVWSRKKRATNFTQNFICRDLRNADCWKLNWNRCIPFQNHFIQMQRSSTVKNSMFKTIPKFVVLPSSNCIQMMHSEWLCQNFWRFISKIFSVRFCSITLNKAIEFDFKRLRVCLFVRLWSGDLPAISLINFKCFSKHQLKVSFSHSIHVFYTCYFKTAGFWLLFCLLYRNSKSPEWTREIKNFQKKHDEFDYFVS